MAAPGKGGGEGGELWGQFKGALSKGKGRPDKSTKITHAPEAPPEPQAEASRAEGEDDDDLIVGEGTEKKDFVPQGLPRAHRGGSGDDEADRDDDDGPEPLVDDLATGSILEDPSATATAAIPEGADLPDEVAELFDSLEKGGSKIGDETRQMVFKTKPSARNVDKIVQVLVRTLVGKERVSEKDLDVLLEITKSKIVEVIKAQALLIYINETPGLTIRHVSFGRSLTARSKHSEKRFGDLTKKMCGMLVSPDSAVGRVMRDGKAKTTLDAAKEPTPDIKQIQAVAEFTIHSMAIVPVAHEGTTYGAIQALNKDIESGEDFFSQKDIELMQEVADYSARVIFAARNPAHQWSGDDVARYVARVAHVEFVDLKEEDVDRATLEMVGERTTRQFRLLPVKKLSVTRVRAAIDDPLDVTRRDAFTNATKLEIGEIVVASRDRIAAIIDRFFGPGGLITTGVASGPVHIGSRPSGATIDKTQLLAVPNLGSLMATPVVIQGRETEKPQKATVAATPGAKPQNLASLGEAFMNELEKKRKEAVEQDVSRGKLTGLDITGDNANAAPVIQLVNRLIEDGHARGASDIHIDPFEQELRVRYRVDGVLEDKMRMPSAAARAIASRIKVMSGLNISENRLPQDGRIRFKEFTRIPGLDFDLRVAFSPMAWGEKIVFRILDKKTTSLGLETMGFTPQNLGRYRRCLAAPHGMILHTGPTGSGKTTTLYAALAELNKADMNIMTAEDPVEFMIPGINQLQTKPQIGLTFARALKAYLRQDPDIILVGEIRDLETAEVAVEAALTGHQLFSTLHTNDAAGTVTRFVEMGIEPFLISSALLCVCSQRLMRKLCGCKVAHEPTTEDREVLGMEAPADGSAEPPPKIYAANPKGCSKCQGSGYKGRIGIHELLVMEPELRELTAHKGVSAIEIDKLARKHGMASLFQDAMTKVRAGVTSLEEALRTVKVEKD